MSERTCPRCRTICDQESTSCRRCRHIFDGGNPQSQQSSAQNRHFWPPPQELPSQGQRDTAIASPAGTDPQTEATAQEVCRDQNTAPHTEFERMSIQESNTCLKSSRAGISHNLESLQHGSRPSQEPETLELGALQCLNFTSQPVNPSASNSWFAPLLEQFQPAAMGTQKLRPFTLRIAAADRQASNTMPSPVESGTNDPFPPAWPWPAVGIRGNQLAGRRIVDQDALLVTSRIADQESASDRTPQQRTSSVASPRARKDGRPFHLQIADKDHQPLAARIALQGARSRVARQDARPSAAGSYPWTSASSNEISQGSVLPPVQFPNNTNSGALQPLTFAFPASNTSSPRQFLCISCGSSGPRPGLCQTCQNQLPAQVPAPQQPLSPRIGQAAPLHHERMVLRRPGWLDHNLDGQSRCVNCRHPRLFNRWCPICGERDARIDGPGVWPSIRPPIPSLEDWSPNPWLPGYLLPNGAVDRRCPVCRTHSSLLWCIECGLDLRNDWRDGP